MGSARPDDYERDPVASAMVEEGAAALRGPGHPVMAAISVAEMARRVGVTERTGYAKWDAEDLHIAVIRRSLGLGQNTEESLNADALVDGARAMIDDDTLPPSEVIAAIFNTAWQALVSDPERRAVYALWPYSTGESRVSQEIRSSLSEYYEAWFKRLLSIIDSYVAKHSKRVSIRDDLDRNDMAFLAVLFAEGAAFHAHLGRTPSEPDFDRNLPGRIIQMLMAYALEFHEDDAPHPFDRHLTRLDSKSEIDLTSAETPRPILRGP